MGAEGEVLQRRDSGFAQSPALKAALKSVQAAIEEEAKLKTPSGADEVAAALKEEIAALQKKLAEANAAREAAEKKVEEVMKAPPSSPAANEGWFGSLCRCLAGKTPEELAAEVASQKAELRAELEPPLRAKIQKVFKEAGLDLDLKKPKPILESGLDSLGLQHLSKTLSDAIDVSEETLTTQVPIEAETTAAQFMERLTAVALEQTVEKAHKDKYGGGGGGEDEAASAAAAEQSKVQAAAKAAEDLEATAPTVKAVPKVSPEELLAGEGLSHLSLGDWAECRTKVVAGRAPLLTYLKEVAGVTKLQERQKLASVLSKALREERI